MTVWLDLVSPITKVHKNICANMNPRKFRTFFLASGDVLNVPHNISVVRTPRLRSPKQALLSLMNLTKSLSRFNIVHTIAEPVFFLLSRTRRNLILSLHGVPLDSYPHFITGKILSRRADVVHSVSKYTAHAAERFYGTKSEVIYNGVDTKFFRPLEHHNERPKVLYVGRLIKWKRPVYMARLAKEFPDVDFVIHGRAPVHGESVAAELGEMARSLPNLRIESGLLTEEELKRQYQTADIFLFPSTDWCPLVVLEAMACGMPLLLYAIGGQAEQVTHGKNGFLSHNYDEMKKHLNYLLEDENIRKEMGKKARERSLQLDWKLVAKRYETMYEKLL